MDAFDFQFVTLTAGMVGLFFICCAVLHRKPKHILEEHFGVYNGGLRHVKESVFKRNQLVLGFGLIILGCILLIFGHSLAVRDGEGVLDRFNPLTLALAMVGCTVFFSSILFWLCRVWSKWHFRQIITEVVSEHAWPFESNMELALEIAQLLNVERSDDDTVETFLAKLSGHLDLPAEPSKPSRATRSSRIGIEFR